MKIGIWYKKDNEWIWHEQEARIEGGSFIFDNFPKDVNNYIMDILAKKGLEGPEPVIWEIKPHKEIITNEFK